MKRTLLVSLLALAAAGGEAPDGERKAAVGNIARTLQNKVSNQVEIPENVERNSPYADTRVEESLSMPDNTSSRVSDSIAEVEVIPWDEEESS